MFNWNLPSAEDYDLMHEILGGYGEPQPGKIIAPTGKPYLYRWTIQSTPFFNLYMHVQVASDEEGMHTHPWMSQSVILSGGYYEVVGARVGSSYVPLHPVRRKPMEVIQRGTDIPHRLLLPDEVEYSLSLFFTGPRVKDWGFWVNGKWINSKDMVRMEGATSKRIR